MILFKHDNDVLLVERGLSFEMLYFLVDSVFSSITIPCIYIDRVAPAVPTTAAFTFADPSKV